MNASLPHAEPARLISRREVEARTSLSRATIWRKVRAGLFPKPVSLGSRVAWREPRSLPGSTPVPALPDWIDGAGVRASRVRAHRTQTMDDSTFPPDRGKERRQRKAVAPIFNLLIWVTDLDLGADPNAKLILFLLVKYADKETRCCWPSQETLAEKAGLCRGTVNRALARLEKEGHIARLRRDEYGRRTSDQIMLTPRPMFAK